LNKENTIRQIKMRGEITEIETKITEKNSLNQKLIL
jgi:hypothetical protein